VLLTATKGSLLFGDDAYEGWLENASLNGALVRFSDGVPVREGDRCVLLIYPRGGDGPIRVAVEVIHVTATMIGTQFLEVDEESQPRLFRIVEEASEEPGRLRSELESLGGHVDGYFRGT
ncbi:MAG: PilZ domain-containing protein, partial [Deltaproteobacteria bacterium]|nr:PilZ domain-containing protein [Deltaproteobacteria bacterium]